MLALLTFTIVGGGFAGVETAGEINDFVRDSAKDYYHNIDIKNIRVVIIQSGNRLLPEMSKKLAEFALQKLHNNGVEVMLNSRVIGATEDSVKLNEKHLVDIQYTKEKSRIAEILNDDTRAFKYGLLLHEQGEGEDIPLLSPIHSVAEVLIFSVLHEVILNQTCTNI